MMWTAERVVRLGVGNDLGEALVLPADDRLGDRLEWDLADLDLVALLKCLRLGQADGRDLRTTVGRTRLSGVVHLVDIGVAGDRVRGNEPFVGRRVGEPQARR